MAGDWIKMRTDLYRDPKVCVMADELMANDGQLSAYVSQHCQRDMTVTRNVMRNVTVGALVSVWGVMRHRGKRVDDDLVVSGCTISIIDDVAELPGFGETMASVGWVADTEEGIVFPGFFKEYNVDPADTSKQKNAERQRAYREKQRAESNVTRNVTVTHREEKSREEKKEEDLSDLLHGVDQQVVTDFRTLRKAKKAAVSRTVLEGIKREAEKAGYSMEAALRTCCERGWQGFKAEWISVQPGAAQPGPRPPKRKEL